MLVVVACILALVVLQQLPHKLFPPKQKPVATNAVSVATNIVEKLPASVEPAPKPVVPDAPEKIVALSNEFIRVEFTSWGGGIRSVELLKHKANGHGNAVLNGAEHIPALSLTGANNEVFEIQSSEPHTITMRGASGVRKTFSLGDGYLLTGNIHLPATTGTISVVVGAVRPMQPQEPPNYSVVDWKGASKFRNRTLPRVVDRVKAGTNHELIQSGWLAVKNQYFTMVLSTTNNVTGVTYSTMQITAGPPPVSGLMASAEVPVAVEADGSGTCEFTYYAGPKEYDRLVALGQHQEELMDFGTPMDFYSGFFGVILVRSLGFFYKLIPNYGVAIILVTVALKIVFWPIQAKSIRSMKEMQKFQPLMAKVREKYKDDQQRMNQELWKLQREHGINPAAGCLPMLVQLPVLIAFYRVLLSDIALRGATFLWIKDLAQPDTVAMVAGFAINPLPLLMVATMILQQRMTPTGGDPQQAKMMMFMPLMMLFFFYRTAAGLTLYWTLQQVLSIVQQWWGMHHDKKAAVVLPAGKSK